VRDGLLNLATGTQLNETLTEVPRQLAGRSVGLAVAGNGTQSKAETAQDALTAGDLLRLSQRYKDSVSKYKDAISNAESAIQ
jgi:hypothetical protein